MRSTRSNFFYTIKTILKAKFHRKTSASSVNQSENSQNNHNLSENSYFENSSYQVSRETAISGDARIIPSVPEEPFNTFNENQPYDTHPPHILTDNAEHILECRNLVKRFGRKVAVRGVNISMKTSQITGLLGPNGAGKTTIFYMIVGFIQPNGGGVYLDHHLLSALPMHKRALLGIAYLPQEPSVFRKLTVEQNIWAILETRGDLTREQKKDELESLLHEFGIHKIRKQFAYTLSGGERRRTEIARALAIKPKFLLLDEPFAGIDPIAVHEIKEIVRQLKNKGIGVLITDHNVRDTLEITDEAHIIHQGEVLISGPREKILESDLAREIYLGENFRM